MQPRQIRQITASIVLLLLILVAGWVAIRLMNPISVGTLELKVTDLPADDSALKQWLTSQTNVKNTSVTRSGSGLTVIYHMPGHDARDFASTVVQECQQLGYKSNGYSVHSEYNPLLTD